MDPAWLSLVVQVGVIASAALWFVHQMKTTIDDLSKAVRGLNKTVTDLDHRLTELERRE